MHNLWISQLTIAVSQHDDGYAMMHKHQMPDGKRMSQHHPSSVCQKLPGQPVEERKGCSSPANALCAGRVREMLAAAAQAMRPETSLSTVLAWQE